MILYSEIIFKNTVVFFISKSRLQLFQMTVNISLCHLPKRKFEIDEK